MYYFTSDEHHGHENIIGYVERPFKNAAHMSKIIIEKHNDTVKDSDTVYHLGDFSMMGPSNRVYFESIMKKYRRVAARHLVLGNHDECKPGMYLDIGFTSVHTSLQIKVPFYVHDTKHILLAHDPCIFQPGCGAIIGICGHVHKLWKVTTTNYGIELFNVGVDVWDYKPVSIEEIANA